MEREGDPETNLYLHFPVKFDSSSKYSAGDSQRTFAVIGETIDVILVAKFRGDCEKDGGVSRWKCRVENMATSVSVGASDKAKGDNSERLSSEIHSNNGNKEYVCKPFASYKRQCKKRKRRWHVVDPHTLTCSLTAALDGLPARCCRADVHVAVWSPYVIPPAPSGGTAANPMGMTSQPREHPFLPRDDDDDDVEEEEEEEEEREARVRHVVTRGLTVMSPPDARCRHVSVAGNHHILVTIQNLYTCDLVVENVTVLPNANDGFAHLLYHPVLGPLAALAADSASEDSDDSSAADVDGNSFVKVETRWSGTLPVTLQPCEMHTFASALSVIDNADLNETQDMHLFAVLTWRKVTEEGQGQQVITHYRLPSVTVRKPGLVITALPDSDTRRGKSFTVNYTISNNLQDFLSLKLVWNPEKALCDPKVNQSADLQNAVHGVLRSVICHQPLCHLGSCKQGSTMTVPIGFQVLNDGVYELGQHLKLKLQYSVTSIVPPPSGVVGGGGSGVAGGGGHQRRGSITSTHSLPVDPRPHAATAHAPNRSASMCPLAADDDNPLSTRRCSLASNRSIGSVATPGGPTPTDGSPVHACGKAGSYGTLLDYQYHHHHHRGVSGPGVTQTQTQTRVHTAPSSATMSPSNRSPVQVASPASGRQGGLPSGAITPQQVLKRNCQVYVITPC